MRNRKMNIAIIGLGNIGSFLYKYLQQNKNILQKKIIVILKCCLFLQKIKQKIET